MTTAKTKTKTASLTAAKKPATKRVSAKGKIADAKPKSGTKPSPARKPVASRPKPRTPVVRDVASESVRQPNALERVNAYARAVLDRDIIAGPHVRNACRRHFDDLEHGRERGIFFNLAKAQHIFDFFEKLLKLSEGQFDGRPLLLAPPQAFIIGSLFGWYQAPKLPDGTYNFDAPSRAPKGVDIDPKMFVRRRFRRAYIEMGKGQGKSPLAGGIGLYGLMADGEGGAQIYAAASKKDQANILFHDAVKMMRRSPALSKRIKPSGGIGKEHNMAHQKSGSFFRAISKEAGKTGSGPRPLFALCDEVHEHPDRSIMEMLERGFKFRVSPLLLMITNSGSDRKSICWEEHEHAVKTAAGTKTPDAVFAYVGEVIDDTTFSYVCAMDKDDDPLNDPTCWIKANPMLNIILSEDYIAGVVKQAKDMPGKRNGILRLHFCMWTDSENGWMEREFIERAMADFNPYEVHEDATAYAGVDLSKTRDLTATAFVVETGKVDVKRINEDGSEEVHNLPTFDLWVEAFTPKDTMAARAEKDNAPYVEWSDTMHPGTDHPYLRAIPGERIRLDHVAAHVGRVSQKIHIGGIAYDKYMYSDFKDECDNQGLEFRHVEHPQGGKIRARVDPAEIAAAEKAGKPKPVGLWMPGSIKLFEDAILDGRVRIRKSPVVMSALMGAAFSAPDDFGNVFFIKDKATTRIDPAIAAVMAFGLIHNQPVDDMGAKFQMFIL